MKFAELDFQRLENAVRRGLGREPTASEADLAWSLAQRAVGGDRQCVVAFALAIRGDASITFDTDGEPIVHARAEQLDRMMAELAQLATRRMMN